MVKDAGGSRTHLELLCRQPPCRLAPASEQCLLAEIGEQIHSSLKVVVAIDPIKRSRSSGNNA